MGFSLGIIGLPNVGKSTLFSALSSNKADIQNYPFTTIDPNVGVVPVPDERLDFIHKSLKTPKAIPTIIEFFDIAGLVKGAHKGEGLGNKFLSHIREVDAVAHVVRCFDSGQIVHVEGKVDPIFDIETVEAELMLSDLELVEKKIQTLHTRKKTGDKTVLKHLDICQKLKDHLGSGKLAIFFGFPEEEIELRQELPLLTFKPVLYIANVDESGNSEQVIKVIESASSRGFSVVPICAKTEHELSEMDKAEADELRSEMGSGERGMDALIREGYKLLKLITFFTTNEKETRAWTVKEGTKAPQAAGKVHSDMEKGFIAADVAHYDDFKSDPDLDVLKQKGLLHLQGKDYAVRDGDIVYIRFKA